MTQRSGLTARRIHPRTGLRAALRFVGVLAVMFPRNTPEIVVALAGISLMVGGGALFIGLMFALGRFVERRAEREAGR